MGQPRLGVVDMDDRSPSSFSVLALCSVGSRSVAVSHGNGEDAPVEVPETRARRPRMGSRHWPAPEATNAMPADEFRRS